MLHMIEHVFIEQSLVAAFAVIGAVMWVSLAISKRFTAGRVHGSAIAIVMGLVLAYAGGLMTGDRLKAFRRTQLRQANRLARSWEEHDAIMTAVAQGDGELASRLMRAHMLNAASAIGRYISTQTRTEPDS